MSVTTGQKQLAVLERIVPSDLETPVSAFMKLRPLYPQKPAFLLESVDRGEQVGRYSILGFEAEEMLKWNVTEQGNPLTILDKALKAFKENVGSPLPFPSGAFGYLSYDTVRAFEKLGLPRRPSLCPDAYFAVPKRLILFDNVHNTMTLIVITEKQNCEKALSEIEQKLKTPLAMNTPKSNQPTQTFTPLETKESFIAKVKAGQEYIKAGDIYQVVLSQKVNGQTSSHPIDIYRALRMLNPSPYMFFLDFVDFQLIGSSPEMLAKVDHGIGQIRPIAGTFPRGKNSEEDRRFAEQLIEDPKERAEHVMLVDLARNDLGRVCHYGSVKVSRLMEIERYSHVMHMVSTVEGEVSPENSCLNVLQAAFPHGTVTGAPKVRAMEIIEELEGAPRGFYAGCVGYVSFSGYLDTCIAIRTLLYKEGKVYLQAGAGIVADSDPEKEYEETLNKLEALKQALRLAENNFRREGNVPC